MPFEELASVVLPPGPSHHTVAFSKDGNQLLFGTRQAGSEAFGVLWVNWRTGLSRALDLPPPSFAPETENTSVEAADVNGQSAIVTVLSHAGGLAFEEQLWLVNQDAGIPPLLIHHARDSGVVFALSSDGAHLLFGESFSKQPQLEVFAVSPFTPRLRIPVAPGAEMSSICLGSDLERFAFATEHRVVCVGADGRELCEWPSEGPLYRLAFAEDDLGLWGISREAVKLFQWKGSPVPFTVSGMRPWAFDAATRRAMFFGAGLCELSLASGAVQTLGEYRAAARYVHCCDVKRRRFAALDSVKRGARIRVFEATDAGD